MIRREFISALATSVAVAAAEAQQSATHHAQQKAEGAGARPQGLTTSGVLQQKLSDPELSGYAMHAFVLSAGPGLVDTARHRHDCELFGYVLEGEIEIGLDGLPPAVYRQGQMFYEPRNIVHSSLKNLSSERAARVLVLQLIKEGRSGYIPVSSEKQ